MRKQELKSRKKMHARKRGKKNSLSYPRKEITIERYKPEVITIKDERT